MESGRQWLKNQTTGRASAIVSIAVRPSQVPRTNAMDIGRACNFNVHCPLCWQKISTEVPARGVPERLPAELGTMKLHVRASTRRHGLGLFQTSPFVTRRSDYA
jgi:hypothetical protein